MKHYIRLSALTLAVLTGTSMESRADIKENFDTYNADGSYTRKHSTAVEKEASPLADYAISGLKGASKPAESILRYAAAYNASYYGIEGLKEATALGLYGLTYFAGTYVAGPTTGLYAANGAYYGLKASFKCMDWLMPGYNGVLAGAYTPLVKLVTDKAIDYAPTALGVLYTGASSLVSSATSLVGSLGSAFGNWFRPEESTADFNFSGSSIERMFSSSEIN